MQIIRKASGKMKLKLKKSEWLRMGQSENWLGDAMEDMFGDGAEEVEAVFSGEKEVLRKDYSKEELVEAIKAIGEESIAGFSGVTMRDVDAIINMLEPHEIAEVKAAADRRREMAGQVD